MSVRWQVGRRPRLHESDGSTRTHRTSRSAVRSPSDRDLFELALEVRRDAHAPISGFKVGAAGFTRSGKVLHAANVEVSDRSTGGGTCAECGIAFQLQGEALDTLLLVADSEEPISPCGACRQTLTDLASPSARIIMATTDGVMRETTLAELLPRPRLRAPPAAELERFRPAIEAARRAYGRSERAEGRLPLQGAAILASDGSLHSGCTRKQRGVYTRAVQMAVDAHFLARSGAPSLAVVVGSEGHGPPIPSGRDRQELFNLDPDLPVLLHDLRTGRNGMTTPREMLPYAYERSGDLRRSPRRAPVEAVSRRGRSARTPRLPLLGVSALALRNATSDASNGASLERSLASEIKKTFSYIDRVDRAFVFFGGALIRPEDEAFKAGVQWGESVFLSNFLTKFPELGIRAIVSGAFSDEIVRSAIGAARKVGLGLDDSLLLALTRTGGGPGIMEAVPLGYRAARAKVKALFPELGDAALEEMKTQGATILLHDEPMISKEIEEVDTFAHLLPRRMALTEGAAGFVCFAGGFGTMNELFEVLRLGRPVVLEGKAFWTDMIETILDRWIQRGLVDANIRDRIAIVDGVEAGLAKLAEMALRDPTRAKTAEPLERRAHEIAGDIERGLGTLAGLPTAVTFLGGHRLPEGSPELTILQEIASRLTQAGVPARVGGAGPILEAVHSGIQQARGSAPSYLQALLYDRGDLDLDRIAEKANVCEVVRSSQVHKLLLHENTDAIVVAFGGEGTFDELWEIVTLLKIDKIPPRPVILVGDDWAPILEKVKEAMLSEERKTIRPEFMDLFVIAKSAEHATELILEHRANAGARKKSDPMPVMGPSPSPPKRARALRALA